MKLHLRKWRPDGVIAKLAGLFQHTRSQLNTLTYAALTRSIEAVVRSALVFRHSITFWCMSTRAGVDFTLFALLIQYNLPKQNQVIIQGN